MLVNQAERTAEQIDACRDDWRPDTRIIQHERFDKVIDVAAMVRGVDHAISRRGIDRRRRVLADAFNFSEDWVKRILERAIQLVALGRAQLLEVRDDALAGSRSREPVAPFQITCDFVSREHGLSDFVHQLDVSGL